MRCTRRPAAKRPRIIGEVASNPPDRFWSRRPTAAAASSTCWWAILCRGFARTSDGDGHARLTAHIEAAAAGAEHDVRKFLRARSARVWPKRAAKCRNAFLRGGRLLAFGRGPYATDAQHVSVEFVHPVIVGKRALPALDLSLLFRPWLEAILHAEDIVMGFGPPEGDPEVSGLCARYRAGARAMTFALPGSEGSYCAAPAHARSLHPSGDDRDSLPHAMGNRSRLLRAP